MKFKTPIRILAWLALVFLVLNSLGSGFSFHYTYRDDGFEARRIDFSLPGWDMLLQIVLLLITCALLLCLAYRPKQRRLWLPLTASALALHLLVGVLSIFLSQYRMYGALILENVLDALAAIAFAALAVSAAAGFRGKAFTLTAALVGLGTQLFALIRFVIVFGDYMEMGFRLLVVLTLADLFGMCALYIALLLVGCGMTAASPAPMTAEQQLRALYSMLELGQITPEVYQARRQEIINNL